MVRVLGLAVAVVMIVLGLLWTLQGLGYVDGAMADVELWAVLGPIVAGLGLALGIVLVQRR